MDLFCLVSTCRYTSWSQCIASLPVWHITWLLLDPVLLPFSISHYCWFLTVYDFGFSILSGDLLNKAFIDSEALASVRVWTFQSMWDESQTRQKWQSVSVKIIQSSSHGDHLCHIAAGQVFSCADCSTHGMTGDKELGSILYMVENQRYVFSYNVARCVAELRHVQIFL